MEYIILNEESIPFESITECNNNIMIFFNIIKEAFNENMTSIRVSGSFDSGWYNLEIAENYYVRDWISSFDDIEEAEELSQIKTLLDMTQSPQIPEDEIKIIDRDKLSDFSLKTRNEIKTPSLGAALLLNQIAISFNSVHYWNHSDLELLKIEIDEKENLIEEVRVVKNATQISHWKTHFAIIDAERKENCKKGKQLWEQREKEFKNLIFCKSTKKEIKRLNIDNATYERLWDNLKKLNKYITESKSDDELKEKTKLNFSDE